MTAADLVCLRQRHLQQTEEAAICSKLRLPTSRLLSTWLSE